MKRLPVALALATVAVSCVDVQDPAGILFENMALLVENADLDVVWGPEQFVRSSGDPDVYRVNITSPDFDHFEPPFVLHVLNGGVYAIERELDRVSAASVVLDGLMIFGASEFSQKVENLSQVVQVNSGSELTVTLASIPGSGLTIWIEGKLTLGEISSWAPQVSGTTNELWGIWGTSASDIFAVGSSFEIRHYDGNAWVHQESGMGGTASLHAVWGLSSADVFAVGQGGVILHYDGISWSQQPSGTGSSDNSLSGVWGTGPANVYAVGQAGLILQYDGSGWQVQPSGTTNMLRDVWGTSPSDVFAVGDGGTILHYDGTGWSPQTSGTTMLLHSVWGTSPNDVFVAGYQGTILHYDGTTWVDQGSPGANLYAVWGPSPTNVYVVGDFGSLLRYDGVAWTPHASGTMDVLYNVWGSGPSDVYIVGNQGTIKRGSLASPTNSTIVASPSQIPADGSSTATITVLVKDCNGVDLWTGGDAVTLGTDLGTLSPVIDNGDGTYGATLSAGYAAGQATITGTLNGVQMVNIATVVLLVTG